MSDVMLVTEEGEDRIVHYQECVWQHSCGSQLFFLHDDGTVQCSRCSNFVDSLMWRKERKP
jgi:hypothetical protein